MSNPQEESAFDKDNTAPVLIIQSMRIYDLLLALLSVSDPQKAAELVELHDQGHTFCPPPKFIEYEDEDVQGNDNN